MSRVETQHVADLSLEEYLGEATTRYKSQDSSDDRSRMLALRLYLANAPHLSGLTMSVQEVLGSVKKDLQLLHSDYDKHVTEEES